jgi:hypothetical protein
VISQLNVAIGTYLGNTAHTYILRNTDTDTVNLSRDTKDTSIDTGDSSIDRLIDAGDLSLDTRDTLQHSKQATYFGHTSTFPISSLQHSEDVMKQNTMN